MSVIIKGLNKFYSCRLCPFNNSDYYCNITKGKIDRDDYSCEGECPIVQLPKGHGRLIEQPTDADIAETIGGQNDFADCIREAVATVFDNAKTVVKADGGDTE